MKIRHVAAFVSDLEKTKQFFEQYFGAEANEKYHNPRTGLQTYFLTFLDGSQLEIMHRPDVIAPIKEGALGYAHIAFGVDSREAVDALTARLVADGYELKSGPRTTGDGYYESCVAGPDNLLLEITI